MHRQHLPQQHCHLIESVGLGISNDTKHHASHAYQVTSHGHYEPEALAPDERHHSRWNSREKVPEHPQYNADQQCSLKQPRSVRQYDHLRSETMAVHMGQASTMGREGDEGRQTPSSICCLVFVRNKVYCDTLVFRANTDGESRQSVIVLIQEIWISMLARHVLEDMAYPTLQ